MLLWEWAWSPSPGTVEAPSHQWPLPFRAYGCCLSQTCHTRHWGWSDLVHKKTESPNLNWQQVQSHSLITSNAIGSFAVIPILDSSASIILRTDSCISITYRKEWFQIRLLVYAYSEGTHLSPWHRNWCADRNDSLTLPHCFSKHKEPAVKVMTTLNDHAL